MTAGSRTMSCGAPSAIICPKFSTSTRCASRITTSSTCSTMISVTPAAWMPRRISASAMASAGLRPPATSSSNNMRGSVASARASSTRFWPATFSSAALTPARSASPTSSSTFMDSRRASGSRG